MHILVLEFLHPYGVTGFRPGGGTLPNKFPYARFKQIRIESKAGTAEFAPGIRLKIAPLGAYWNRTACWYLPPVEHGPGLERGILDNKELVVGSILYLPVQVAGGLISIGDDHALQGDGEVTLTALETSLRGSVQIFMRKGKPTHWSRGDADALHHHGTEY